MGLTISQITAWRGKNNTTTNNTNTTNSTNSTGNNTNYLSYDVFLGLSVLGGFFALDHLYLRSPLTFIAKLITNFFTFGMWWLYDASQAIFNRDVLKVYGLGIPGLGPKGIAAGVLASDIPDKKHMSFFVYALALFAGGIFGLDSFIVGDKKSGFIRLMCLISFIMAPVAILWWLYNTGLFLFKTKDVVNKYSEYFGAPPSSDHGMSIAEKLVAKFPFLKTLLGPAIAVKSGAESAITTATQIAETVFDDPIGAATATVKTVAKPVMNAATTAVSTVAGPIMPTIDSGLDVAKQGIELGRSALNTGSTIATKTLNVVDKTATAAAAALALAPQAASLSSSFTPAAAEQALSRLGEQIGGSQDNDILPYMVIGTLALIALSSIILSYSRIRQNGQNRQNRQPYNDDAPPEPRVFRESNKKESHKTT